MRLSHIPMMAIATLITVSSSLHAQNYPAPPSGAYYPGYQTKEAAPSRTSRTPLDVLKAGIEMLQDFISSGDIYDQDKLEVFVNRQVKPFFDFDEMSRLVAGRFYAGLDAEKRAKFRSRLEEMFLLAFMRQVSQHAGPQPQVDFLSPRFRGPDEVEALARVLFQDGSAKRLVFRFHRSQKGWKVYDVAANGTSAVLYYRRHFHNQVRRHGPEALLK